MSDTVSIEVSYVTVDELDAETPVALAERDGRVVVFLAASATGEQIAPALELAFAAWQERTGTSPHGTLVVQPAL